MGLVPYYFITLITLGVITFLSFSLIMKMNFIKAITSFVVYLLLSFLISGVLVYFFFFSNGEYVNRGIGGIYITVLFVLIGNAISYPITQSMLMKKQLAFSKLFFVLLPICGLLYIITFIVTARILNI